MLLKPLIQPQRRNLRPFYAVYSRTAFWTVTSFVPHTPFFIKLMCTSTKKKKKKKRKISWRLGRTVQTPCRQLEVGYFIP